jgi:outer membrane protein assembly factor BamD
MKRNRIVSSIILIVLFLWLIVELAGCSWFRKRDVTNPDELALRGMEAYEDGDYRGALKAFNTLKERYPYSRYAILAELKIGDAHFHRKEYPEAIAAYEEFASLHPKNEAIPYVLFQIGACYYEQLETKDRDQTATREAITSFERLVQSHPTAPEASKANERIQICRELLAKNELYVAYFYYKSKHYKAALGRFEIVLSTYSDVISSETRREVEEFVVICRRKVADIIE